MPDALDVDDDADGGRPEAALRIANKRIQELEGAAAKVAELERREAFRSAGLDPTDKKLRYFVDGYKGELVPEAIQAEAMEAGYMQPAPKPEPDATVSALGRVTSAAAGPSGSEPFPAAQVREAAAGWKSYEDVVNHLRRVGYPIAGEE